MNALNRIITRTCTGFLLAMTAGAPAIADDTELLLVPPPSSDATEPRIMFIIDTSTSMNSTEDTAVPYDGAQTYGGDCDSNVIYYMTVNGVLPNCAGGTTQIIDKANFHCAAAGLQMSGLGSYSGVMAQYRDGGKDGTGSGPSKWQFLAVGYNSAPVECEADEGVHGDGRATFLWAQSGSNNADPYTEDSTDAISWNGAPRNQSYTLYDGNYLNWEANPVIISVSRIDIVKQVLTTLFSSISNVRVGVERFNDDEGGTIIQGLIDIDTNRAAALAAVDSLTPEDHTTIAESAYESVLYWLGMPAEFAEIDGDNENFTDHGILVDPSAGPGSQVYVQPELNVCARNFNVLLSDGRAGGRDDKTEALTPLLPGYTAATGRTFCDDVVPSESDGICIDDIAEYLFKTDISPDASGGLPGEQNVIMHTVGFALDDTDNLRSAAERGGGTFYFADDGPSLAAAFLEIVSVIADRDLSFTAPAVSVNAFNRTQNLNDLYLTVFKPQARVHWPGNLKKYRLVDRVITDANGAAAVDPATGFFFDTAKSFWTSGAADGDQVALGGAANALPDPSLRNLYTNNSGSNLTAANNALTPSNAGAFSNADFGLTGSAGEPSIDEIIRWARGEDLLDEDNDSSTTVRYAMGDPLHSQPAAVVYGGTETNPDVVVFSATNDGYLHAINGSTGAELWSFVPKELLPRFAQLYFDAESKYKQYGIDGNVVSVVKDENKNGIVDGSDFVYLIFGLRRGGFNYYALDVTNKNSPQLLWKVTYPEMGESWSTPVIARIDINTAGTNADDAVVILGGGYDTVHDTATFPSSASDAVGNGIHMLDLVSGAELWRAGPDAGADLQLASMTRSIVSQVRVIDMTGDGLADRMYAADLGGQLLRFDIKNGETPANLATGGVIAQLGAEGLATADFADTRRFYTTPDVSLFTDGTQNRRFISLSIGSGYRAHPLDESAADRFFSVRDPDVFNQLTQAEYDSYNIVTDADLVEISGQVRTIISTSDRGWKFTLPANQKVLSNSVTFGDTVTFVGFSPEANSSDQCAPSLGKNFLYRVRVENGDPVVNNLDTLAAADADDKRMEELEQGGIAPEPTILFPSPDDPNCTGTDCAVPPIGCVGVECFDPGYANNPVRTLWTQDGIE
ncbi:MAG: PQQ-binding-like beta-propeller repeat protein [Proteobacteria bacterium]|nr:PQQ-binding-like beta-propeller repeat protein [Pseudomonadota bacterium]